MYLADAEALASDSDAQNKQNKDLEIGDIKELETVANQPADLVTRDISNGDLV